MHYVGPSLTLSDLLAKYYDRCCEMSSLNYMVHLRLGYLVTIVCYLNTEKGLNYI